MTLKNCLKPRGQRYYGKFRGTVADNVDPLGIGRVRVAVPDVWGPVAGEWAMPCLPVCGPQMGAFLVPPVGAGVWVEFEQGDAARPIWVGGFWATSAEVPPLASGDGANIVLQSAGQNGIVISDLPGPTSGIMLRAAAGATLVISDAGIFLQNGKGASIALTGPSVLVNNDALAVT